MSTEPESKTPPYPSKISFDNYLKHLQEHPPLPTRIDKGVMAHLNYGTQQAVLGALRYFRLVDKDDAPTAKLEKLVAANNGERPALIAKIIEEGYPFLFDKTIDLKRVSPHEFEEKFKAATSATGGTADKAISFLLALAADARMELSPHLVKRKPTSPSGPRKAKTRRSKPEAAVPDPLPPKLATENSGDEMTKMLLGKFPEFDPAWPDPIKAKWFEGFEKLMKSAIPKEGT